MSDPMNGFTMPHMAAPPADVVARIRWTIADAVTMTWRNLSHIRRVPEKLLDVTMQPIVLVLLFAYVLGSAIHLEGSGNYREYLIPGIFVQSIFFAAAGSAVDVAVDMARGIIDRFRSLPVARSAVVVGRTVADLFDTTLSLAVMTVCGFLVGWRVHNGFASAAAAFGLLLLFSFGSSWMTTFIGLMVRTPEAATGVTMAILIPLTFVANTFIPIGGLPGWLRTATCWSPISAAAAACRQLFGNPDPIPPDAAWPLHHPVAAFVGWSIVLLVVFVPLTVWRYRNATSH
ncbi:MULTISPECIES: ABC transporter permease [unclassified Nocardia]|uniref:ABC transporter permease n=1 Tax=unclassified Nocardia TaxID=2637762 RepID=UPI001CE4446E|nr:MULTISPECIES: ABC transporter permease [unclassified Nocardia]